MGKIDEIEETEEVSSKSDEVSEGEEPASRREEDEKNRQEHEDPPTEREPRDESVELELRTPILRRSVRERRKPQEDWKAEVLAKMNERRGRIWKETCEGSDGPVNLCFLMHEDYLTGEVENIGRMQ